MRRASFVLLYAKKPSFFLQMAYEDAHLAPFFLQKSGFRGAFSGG
jgi:hypothetical protein